MSLHRDQFAFVLAALRSRFRQGEWIDGEALPIADLATQIGVSTTPIREALSRLAGEGLVEDWRGRGYQARRLDAIDLADLYRAQQALAGVASAAASCPDARPAPRFEPAPQAFIDDPVDTWERLFETLMRAAGAGFLLAEQRRLADQLAAARRVEPEVLAETDQDFAPLADAISAGDWPAATAALEPLFRRRRAAVDAMVANLRLAAARYIYRI